MRINVQRVEELSTVERTRLQRNLVWMRAATEADWAKALWCVTLENGEMTLAILVDTLDESLFDEVDQAVPA